MFFRLAAISALVAPFASALTVATPTDVTSADPVNITWTAVAGDPAVFSIQLINPTLFHTQFAIDSNVPTGIGGVTITLPALQAGDGYSINLINISNESDIFASSGDFSVGPTTSTLTSSGTSSVPPTATPVTPTGAPPSSNFGTTVSSSSVSSTSPGGSSTSSGTSTTSSSSSSASAFSNGAAAAFTAAGNTFTGHALMAVAAFVGAGLVAL